MHRHPSWRWDHEKIGNEKAAVRRRQQRGRRGESEDENEHLLLQLPLSVIQRTDIPRLEPPGDTMEVERMLSDRQSNSTLR